MVALPCGSRSTSSTRFPAWASAAARLTLVVVLPTPPFWFTTASTRAISVPEMHEHKMALGVEERHVQTNRFRAVERRRSGAFHCGENSARRDKVAAGGDEV